MTLPALLKFICDHPINRRRKMGAVIDFISWQMISRMWNKPLVYHWINGTRVLVHRGDNGFTCNIYCGLHDLDEMAFLLHVLREDDLFIDVGANVGAYTLLASVVRHARAVCFEPVPATFSRLQQNLGINRVENLVTAHNEGVGEKAALLRFSNNQNCENHVLHDDEKVEATTVKIATLDQRLEGLRPNLLKIDVEGFELFVLRGAETILQKPELYGIILELNGAGGNYGYRDSDVVNLLKSHGFASYHYDPFARKLTPREPLSCNVLFIRDLRRVEALVQSSESFRIKKVIL